ncbi:hypothetical protein DWY99_05845 [[Clostridium] leptum]|uniref:Uncharacterized protein n=1 Tax=[Clostridium] leptum TaxID=1535 RepID=A0A412AY91_9FIRM|nr:hypothetical protein DWY99_05845 [[Clostridium] leptum]
MLDSETTGYAGVSESNDRQSVTVGGLPALFRTHSSKRRLTAPGFGAPGGKGSYAPGSGIDEPGALQAKMFAGSSVLPFCRGKIYHK